MRFVVMPIHPLQPTEPQCRPGQLDFGAETEEKRGRSAAEFPARRLDLLATVVVAGAVARFRQEVVCYWPALACR